MRQKVRDEAQVEGRATVMHEAHLNAGDEVMKRRAEADGGGGGGGGREGGSETEER